MTKEKIDITFDDLMRWREALATCAIEGNKWAEGILKLWKTDRNAYIREIIRLEVTK